MNVETFLQQHFSTATTHYNPHHAQTGLCHRHSSSTTTIATISQLQLLLLNLSLGVSHLVFMYFSSHKAFTFSWCVHFAWNCTMFHCHSAPVEGTFQVNAS